MKTLELPDSLYDALQESAERDGFSSVAEMLVAQHRAAVLAHNRAWFEETDRMREELKEKYGVQPSCVPLIRADRDR